VVGVVAGAIPITHQVDEPDEVLGLQVIVEFVWEVTMLEQE
jgi:hypothetical protein